MKLGADVSLPERRSSLRVVHLTSVHRPGDTRILHRECVSVAAAGYDIELVAPWPGARVPLGVTLRSVARYPGKWRRFVRTIPQVFREALAARGDLYHFHDPELLIIGLLLRARGRSVIYDAHEDLPMQLLAKEWIPKPLRHVASHAGALATRLAGAACSGVVTATQTVAERFPAAKTCVVQNFPSAGEFGAAGTTPHREREPVVAYVGDLTPIRGVREMVAAMSLVDTTLGARLIMAGTFNPPAVHTEVASTPGWSSVDAVGWVDRTGVSELLGRARMGLVTLHPTRNYRDAQPVKLFEYQAAGLPVIASDFQEWSEFLDGGRAGLMVDPLDPGAIAEAIEWVLTHPAEAEEMGRRGRALALRQFNWDAEAERLVKFYDHLLGV